MKTILSKKSVFQQMKIRICSFVLLALSLLSAIGFSACKKKVNYFDYVSELRNNVFLCTTQDFSLRVYSSVKETPYVTDGIPRETSPRTEIYLSAPSGDKNCVLSFTVNGKTYGGEMSFDNVKTEYYYSCTLDISELDQLVCSLEYGEIKAELTALSVRTETTLSPNTVLTNLRREESELFSSMTDKYGFTGEIYIRLIYEDSPYYYIGIIDRKGKINAFLINAETGKILAKRQS